MVIVTGTATWRPSADQSCAHDKSSGSTGYNLINEVNADDAATYIEQHVNDTSDKTIKSTFTMTTGDSIPAGATITGITFYIRHYTTNTDNTNKFTSTITMNGTSASTSEANFSSGWTTQTTTFSNFNGQVVPSSCTFQLSTHGKKSRDKDAGSYNRITWVAMTVDWTYSHTDVWYKENGTWKEAKRAYKKVNGTWTEVDGRSIGLTNGQKFKKS